MSLITKLKTYKSLAENDEFPYFPVTVDFLQPYLPCYLPDVISIVSGSSSSGKSSLSKFMMFKAIEYAILSRRSFKIIWFALEETPEQFEYSILSYLLNRRFNIEVSMMELMSMSFNEKGERFILDPRVIAYCERLEPELQLFMDYFIFFTESSSFGIYKKIQGVAQANGKFYHEGKEVRPSAGNADFATEIPWTKYVQESETTFFVVIDHVSLLRPSKSEEGERGVFNAIANIRHFCNVIVTKHFKMHTIFVQQQTKGQESLANVQQSYYFPSALGLDTNKSTYNDCRVFIGITSPKQFLQTSWRYFNTQGIATSIAFDKLDSEFRVLNIAKNTFGRTLTNPEELIPVAFHAKSFNFTKLMK